MIPEPLSMQHAILPGDLPDDLPCDYKNRAFPCIYSFFNEDEIDAGDAIEDVGYFLTAGQSRRIVIRLDPDFTFKILWTRYTVYTESEGEYNWYQSAGFYNFYDYQRTMGLQWIRYISVSMSYLPDTRYGYGGSSNDTAQSVVPVPIPAIQGYDYGYGQIRNTYMLPRGGAIVIEASNTHPSTTLLVNGAVHGVKIRI